MTERASIVQAAQIGAETTPGTIVTAGKRLLSVGFKQAVKLDTKAEASMGYKAPTGVSIGKEWSEGTFDGYAGYNDLAYLLAGVLVNATPTGSGADKTWTFTPAFASTDTPKTYTLQVGDAATRHTTTAHNLLTDLTVSWAKDGIVVSGSYMGKAVADTSGALDTATAVTNIVAQANDTDFYLDLTSSADLGTTRLTRVIKAQLSIKSRWKPAFFADSSEDSFTTFTEAGLDVELKLTIAADSTGMGLLTQYRAGSLVYPRWSTVGPLVSSLAHTFQFDMAGRITDGFALTDEDGIYGHDLTIRGVIDPGWSSGRVCQAVLINSLAAL